MKITDKLRPQDRGLVREIKVPKLRDETLEKEYAQVTDAHKKAKYFFAEKIDDEKNKLNKLNTVVLRGQAMEVKQQTVDKNIKKVKELIEQLEKDFIDRQNAEKEEDKRKLVKEDPALSVYKQRLANLQVDLMLLQTAHEEMSEEYKKVKTEYDKSVETKVKAQILLDEVTRQSELYLKKGQEFADKDYTNAISEIEEARKELKYVKYKPIGQTKDKWIFLLIQPEELDAQVSVTVKP